MSNYDEKKLEFAIASYGHVPQSRSYSPAGLNTVRSAFGKDDYGYYRPGEGIPCTIDGSIEVCNRIYRETPFVRSIIDMMSDFTVEGIRIEHRNPQIQNFLNNWAKFINFELFSERLANMLYRTSNCPVKIVYGTVPGFQEKKWKKSTADIIIKKEKVKSKFIPLKYEILNPNSIEVIGEDISAFIGEPVYGLRLPYGTESDVRRMREIVEKYNLGMTIPDIKPINIDGKLVIPLPKERFKYLFYKKDDWCPKAWPMIHSVLGPLLMLEKMHLADKKALDGAISQIRLWTLGNFENRIYPTPAAVNKLRDTLANVGSGDSMDVIWGPELTFKESDPKGYQFLKKEKYEQVMTEIYAGLGVPASLTGDSNSEGYNASSISMKAMVERLEYGRKVIKSFWEEQLEIIQKSFGWRHPAIISFDHKVMSDETLERKILIDLWDRNVISTEKLRQLCRQDSTLEELRIRKEANKMQNGKIPPKASPYHNSNLDIDLKKIIMQSGIIAPSELGVELKPRKEGEKTLLEAKTQFEAKTQLDSKNKGIEGQGRPLGTRDTTKRQRKDRPRLTRASNDFGTLVSWANNAQAILNKKLSEFFLLHKKKDNLKSLTKAERVEFEQLKFLVLCNLKPFEEITDEVISRSVAGELDNEIVSLSELFINSYKDKNQKEPTIAQIRQMQSAAYAIKYEVKKT